MDPATIIGIGSTLLGGLFAPKPKYVVPDYAKIRSGAEAAGFNPLTALTQGPAGQVVQPENYMGNAIASAGLMLADNLTKTARAARLQKLTGENEKLQDKVQRLTLQPKVGGVYARRESVPTLGAALGRSNAAGVRSSSTGGGAIPSRGAGDAAPSATPASDLRPIPTTDPMDPRREVDAKKVPSSSGFVVVDNPHVPFPIYMPSLDGDETIGPDVITVPLSVAGSAGYALGGYHNEQIAAANGVGPVMSIGGQQWMLEKPKPPGMTKGRAYRYGSVGQDGYALREPPLSAF